MRSTKDCRLFDWEEGHLHHLRVYQLKWLNQRRSLSSLGSWHRRHHHSCLRNWDCHRLRRRKGRLPLRLGNQQLNRHHRLLCHQKWGLATHRGPNRQPQRLLLLQPLVYVFTACHWLFPTDFPWVQWAYHCQTHLLVCASPKALWCLFRAFWDACRIGRLAGLLKRLGYVCSNWPWIGDSYLLSTFLTAQSPFWSSTAPLFSSPPPL